jgi:ABC-2 type transport system ATP-binding protein/lipopolysaccharide transport system ATP-binding protein
MARNAVELHDVSKRYLLGEDHGANLRETLSALGSRLVGRARSRPSVEEVWSLRDVNLEVPEGQALGIIGRNGAGKSTLLKVLTRITEPTTGVSRTRGRVGALLEVGTGFHPELTGRENVYLNGAILGMTRKEMDRRFDEIVAFSGVERFLDTPIKRYSSGMYLRLAFSVAAHLEPDILVVDEVLAVGDAEFQRKCLGRMEKAEGEGRTVIFVSHYLDAVLRLCPTTVWLDAGRVVQAGPTADVVAAYLSTTVQHMGSRQFAADPTSAAWVTGVEALDPAGRPAVLLQRDEPVRLEVRFTVHMPLPTLNVAVSIENLRGVKVLDEAWFDSAPDDRGDPGRYVARIEIPPVLAAGEYSVSAWVGTAYETVVWEPDALGFRLEGGNPRSDRLVELGLPWDVRRIGD